LNVSVRVSPLAIAFCNVFAGAEEGEDGKPETLGGRRGDKDGKAWRVMRLGTCDPALRRRQN